MTIPFFLPLTVGVVAGDTIAGEASLGTLRYLLVRPAGRSRLLLVKAGTAAVFCLVGGVDRGAGRAHRRGDPFPHRAGHHAVGHDGVAARGDGADLRRRPRRRHVAVRLGRHRPVHLDPDRRAGRRHGGDGGPGHPLRRARQPSPRSTASTRGCSPTAGWPSATCSARPVRWTDIRKDLLLQLGYVAVFGSAAWARFTTKDVLSYGLVDAAATVL